MDTTSVLAAFGVPAQYVALFAALIGVASALAAALPVPASGKSVYGRLWQALNFVAMNIGNAKSATMPVTAPAILVPKSAVVPVTADADKPAR